MSNFNEESGKVAFSIHEQIIENETARRKLLLENAELIHMMKDKEYYKAILGDENAPWTGYLTQHEVFYSASKVYALDKVFETFTKKLGIPLQDIADIPITKLSSIVNVVNEGNVDEWLSKARELTAQDFKDELRIAQGKQSYHDCKHENEVDYGICQSCGYRHRKNDSTKAA